MLNVNPGAEDPGDGGEKDPRFVGLTVNVSKNAVYLRGMDMEKKQYRTYNVENVELDKAQVS